MTRWTTLSLLLGLLLPAAPALAEESVLPANITFVTSTGFWEESGDPAEVLDPTGQAGGTKTETARRGYYKLIAVRQADGTAHIVLQQVALDPEGPQVISSAELEEFSQMKAYVTDIRPENSDGVTQQPGLFATVYLRTDPKETEPQGWTVLIDDIGDIRIERESN